MNTIQDPERWEKIKPTAGATMRQEGRQEYKPDKKPAGGFEQVLKEAL